MYRALTPYGTLSGQYGRPGTAQVGIENFGLVNVKIELKGALAKTYVTETQDCVPILLVLLVQLMVCKLAILVGLLEKGAMVNERLLMCCHLLQMTLNVPLFIYETLSWSENCLADEQCMKIHAIMREYSSDMLG